MFGDMENVNADINIREAAFGEGDKAAVHVTAEEADAPTFLKGIAHEIGGEQEVQRDLGRTSTMQPESPSEMLQWERLMLQ